MVLKEAMLIFDYFGISSNILQKNLINKNPNRSNHFSFILHFYNFHNSLLFFRTFPKKYPELNVYKNYQDLNIALNTSNFFFAIVFTDRNGKFINIENESIYFQRKKMVQSNHVINEG